MVISGDQITYKGKVTDNTGNVYSLSDVSIDGDTIFHCRLKDAVFTLGFERIQSLTINTADTTSPFKGFVLCNLALDNGNQMQVYIDLDNRWLSGTEENFKVKIKFLLTAISRLEFVQEVKQPPAVPTK
jgi:hypothetical protein